MAIQQTSDKAERVWRAVLAHIRYEKLVDFAHYKCADRQPEKCSLYEAIAEAMGGEE